MSIHEGNPPLSSYRGSALRSSEAQIDHTTAKLASLDAGASGRVEVLRALEQLVERLSECLPRERASHRYLPRLDLKGNYRLVMGPHQGLSCPTPIGQLGIFPNGDLVTSSLGGFLLRWTQDGAGSSWRSKLLHRGDDAAPHFDIDPRLGLVHSLDEVKVVVGAPSLGLPWVCSPIASLQEQVRSVEVLDNGSVAVCGMRQLLIATPQGDGSWKTEEHGIVGNLRAASVLASGWIFIGDDNRTAIFHRGWPGGASRRQEIGRRGGDAFGESISAMRVLGDRSVAVGRRSGGVSIISQGADGEWRERMLSAAGAPVIALQSVAAGSLVSLRSNGEVSLWSPEDDPPHSRGYFQFSRPSEAGVWRERRLLTWDAICVELHSNEFFFTDGRVTPEGVIYLVGSLRKGGVVLVFDGDRAFLDRGREVAIS